MPEYTALIDLTQSEDEILAAMKTKGRYNIRLAEKK
jgi:lipid II:glycine glycyltransferase (peptidoglycan interpeptide bridge formation enzyme)